MKSHTGKSLMLGRARSFGEPDIEFENEAEIVLHRIVREHLPPAKKNGRAAMIMRRGMTQQASGTPA